MTPCLWPPLSRAYASATARIPLPRSWPSSLATTVSSSSSSSSVGRSTTISHLPLRTTRAVQRRSPRLSHGGVHRCVLSCPSLTSSASLHPRNFSTTPLLRSSSANLRSLPLADIGEGITEVEVLKWHISVGSQVEEFDKLCEVQSDKASVEITSRYAGLVERLGAKEGEVLKVGGELCAIRVLGEEDGQGESGGGGGGGGETGPEAISSAVDPAEVEQVSAPLKEAATPRRPHPLDDNGNITTSSSAQSNTRAITREEQLRTLATPAVRRLCKENNLDIASISGTGKEGRVTREDVLVHLGKLPSSTSTPQDVPSGKSLPSDNVQQTRSAARTTGQEPAQVPSQPLTGIRKAMFKSLSLSTHIPHFTFSEELDVTDLEEVRLKVNRSLQIRKEAAAKKGSTSTTTENAEGDQAVEKLTLLPFLLKALSYSMNNHPLMRSRLSLPATTTGTATTTHQSSLERYASLASEARLVGPRVSHDIAFALSTPSGLLTPVIRSVEQRSVLEIAQEVKRLQRLALSPSGLSRADLEGISGDVVDSSRSSSASTAGRQEGATVILSNIGSIGCGTAASPVLPPTGELAIGAICSIKRGFKWSNDPTLPSLSTSTRTSRDEDEEPPKLLQRLLIPTTFAGDHRVLQGTELALFVKEWKWVVEHPEMWIALGK